MIESLHSPHIARVKALLGSRGKKERGQTGLFVAEGIQCLREAVVTKTGPRVETLFITRAGLERVNKDSLSLNGFETIEVSDEVMHEMAETVTPQGILAICHIPERSISDISLDGNSRFIFLQEAQDPGNAGTILRSADAMGFAGVVTSPGSVDMYSPKVVRATAGSLWHIPVYEAVTLDEILEVAPTLKMIALAADAQTSISDFKAEGDILAIFGNEARGLEDLDSSITRVRIPMPGDAESLNLSAAASIVMFILASQISRTS